MGGALVFLGFVLMLFPAFYKVYFNYLYKTRTPVAVNSNTGSERQSSAFDEGPIRIDGTLLEGAFDESLAPDRILIPSLSLDLAVKPAKVIDGKWEVFEDSAAFGIGSAIPGSRGNSVIFAHAREGAFLPLRKIKIGYRIYLVVGEKIYTYSVFDIHEVMPNDLSVLSAGDEEILTLYTCSGFQDMKRLIVTARRF